VVLIPARQRIETDYLDGPFRHLHSHWQFADLPQGGCECDFAVDFEFRNAILQAVIGVVFDEAMRRVVRAFEARAEALYGGARAGRQADLSGCAGARNPRVPPAGIF
jgi:coenzyme Q-binding protein COQ10